MELHYRAATAQTINMKHLFVSVALDWHLLRRTIGSKKKPHSMRAWRVALRQTLKRSKSMDIALS